MENFSDKQNEVFGKLFGELKKKNASFEVKAHTLIMMDDVNFTKIYKDSSSNIVGPDNEINAVTQRAKELNLV